MKQGDILINKYGNKRKILGVSGYVYHISENKNYDKCWEEYTKQEIEAMGYTVEAPAWEPQLGEFIWFIHNTGWITQGVWDGMFPDRQRASFLGVYRTEEEAQAMVERIKETVEKIKRSRNEE